MVKIKPALIILIVIVVVILAFTTYWQFFKDDSNKTKVGGSDYQAVFLTSGQVYFGQVADQNEQFVVLSDIYYLRVSQALQPPINEEEESTPQSQLSLIKLGRELHGPVDEMNINRDHILFIEDLRADSKVVEAIKDHKDRLEN